MLSFNLHRINLVLEKQIHVLEQTKLSNVRFMKFEYYTTEFLFTIIQINRESYSISTTSEFEEPWTAAILVIFPVFSLV